MTSAKSLMSILKSLGCSVFANILRMFSRSVSVKMSVLKGDFGFLKLSTRKLSELSRSGEKINLCRNVD